MNTEQAKELESRWLRQFTPPPKEAVSDWCCRELVIPSGQSEQSGPFTLSGREYCREPLDDFGNRSIMDQVECFGSQTGKTTIFMGGLAWFVVNDPCSCMWVVANENMGRRLSKKRWVPIVEVSKVLRDLIPVGAERHDFATLEQRLGLAELSFCGSNSPANLASQPVRLLIMDEVDKFSDGTKSEADAVNLAEQRTKSFSNPKRVKSSTPTLFEGLIWQEFLKGDQRRYFVPCVFCGKFMLWAWSESFTALTKTAPTGFVKWDKEAKRADGSWDEDRVHRSAHIECPHCGGHIQDAAKTRMVRRGEWRPTAQARAGFRSRHLSSLYAAMPQTSFGSLAVKFLKEKQSLNGLRGFVNGTLAEPWQNQDVQTERVEIISPVGAETPANGITFLTADFQGRSPHFWYVARIWWPGGNSRGVEAGSCDTWEDLRAIQERLNIPDQQVVVDSGFNASEVYANCVRFGQAIKRRSGHLPLHIGWMPAKGLPRKAWRDPKNNVDLPYYLRGLDPALGSVAGLQGRMELKLLEFSSDTVQDILSGMRKGKAGVLWEVPQSMATPDYWRHLDSHIQETNFNRFTGRSTLHWRNRSQHWPDHLLDCELEQVAVALFNRLFESPKS